LIPIVAREQPVYRVARDEGVHVGNKRQNFRPVHYGGRRLGFARIIKELNKKILTARFENAQ
jgi:hypothetical protein